MTRLHRRGRFPSAFTYLDLLVVLCLIPLLVVACYPSTCRSRETANRVKCASNLRQIGQAMLLYAEESGGAFPRTRTSIGPRRIPTFGTGAATADPFADDGPAENDVTAAFFLLLRTQDITSEVFTCPSSSGEKDNYGTSGSSALDRSNFTDVKKNLSYSLHNPYAGDDAIARGAVFDKTLGVEFAIAADINPGTAGGDDVFKTTATSSAKEMRFSNSSNHDNDGQNILYGDGHVQWESNPFSGVKRDNIYTTADGKLLASPVDGNDSILLPTDD